MLADMRPSLLRALFLAGLIAAMLSGADSAGPSSLSQETSPAHQARIAENYGKLPLSFEANTGQVDKSVRFLSRGNGYGLYLTGNEAVLELIRSSVVSRQSSVRARRAPAAPRSDMVGRSARAGIKSGATRSVEIPSTDYGRRTANSVLRLCLLDANAWAAVAGAEELPGKINYFIGNDPAKWHASVPTYAQVRYRDIYPGIDLVYYGNQQQLEFDYIVAPHADPSSVRLRFDGADNLHLAANGDLAVTIAHEALSFHKPSVYQMVDGRRHTVAGDFALLAKHTVGFRLGSYNHAATLVIDPVLAYSTFLGGSVSSTMAGDAANAIAVDDSGNVYVAGRACSTNFPVTPGAYQTTNLANDCTAFVSKLNSSGTALVYSTYLGGSGGATANTIAVDTAGNVYVTGDTFSTDLPVTPGAFQTTNHAATNQSSNAFVTKLNASGTALVYSTYLGGSGNTIYPTDPGDIGNAIALDAAGNAYVTGTTVSSDFPVTPGAFQTTNRAAAPQIPTAFVTKLNPEGTALVYSTYLGGNGQINYFTGDTGNGIFVDASGDAYVAGAAYSSNFPVTPGAFQTTNHAVASNYDGNAFITEMNPTGTALVYSTYLGGSGSDAANTIAADATGNVYVAGQTISPDFPVTPGAFQTTYAGSAISSPNAFVTKLNPAGTALVYSTYLGGSGGVVCASPILFYKAGDQASGLAVDSSGNAYVAGATVSANFPVTSGAYQTTNHDQISCYPPYLGGYNAFITELNSAGSALVYSTYLGGSGLTPAGSVGVILYGGGDRANALALDSSENVYVAGSTSSYDFPVTAGAFQTTDNSAGTSGFIAKLNMGGASTAIAPTVAVTPASTTITSAAPVTVTVSVSGGSGNPTPTGTVTLAGDTYASAATTLSGGSAKIGIPAGSLLADPADPQYPPSTDGLIANYVPDTASSATYKFASGQASVYVMGAFISVTPGFSYITPAQAQSQAFPLTMVATGGAGNPTPTGTVNMTTGNYSSGAIALAGGNASVSIPPGKLPTGFNTVDVSYSGDGNYTAVPVAGSASIVVGPVTVSVAPSSSSITANQPLPVTITLSAGSGNPVPNGAVLLTSGSYSALANPVGGIATVTIPAGTLSPGTDILTATFQGGGNYLGGASGQATVNVTAATPSFTITATPNTISMGTGLVAMSTITVTPAGGFTGSVALTAAITSGPSGAQSPPTLSFGGANPVSITGTAAGTATLQIETTPSDCAPGNLIDFRLPWYPTGGAALACLLFFGLAGQRRSRRRMFATLALLATLACGVLACGGGPTGNCPPATTAGTYVVTVTGTSGSTTATGTVTINVQ